MTAYSFPFGSASKPLIRSLVGFKASGAPDWRRSTGHCSAETEPSLRRPTQSAVLSLVSVRHQVQSSAPDPSFGDYLVSVGHRASEQKTVVRDSGGRHASTIYGYGQPSANSFLRSSSKSQLGSQPGSLQPISALTSITTQVKSSIHYQFSSPKNPVPAICPSSLPPISASEVLQHSRPASR